MNKEQLIKELNGYTKEQLIKAIAAAPFIDTAKIRANLFKEKSKDIDTLVEAAYKEWQRVNKEFITYLKELEAKNDKLTATTLDELTKYNELNRAEKMAYAHLQAMYDEQDKLYEKVKK